MTSEEPVPHVVDNPDRGRYELRIADRLVSFANYQRTDVVITVSHVETVVDMRGQGMSDRLMRGLLDDLRRRGLAIRPLCWVAADYVRVHPDDADLLAS